MPNVKVESASKSDVFQWRGAFMVVSSAPSQQVGATIHIQPDADCRVTDYGNDLGVIIKANHDTIIILKRGKHDLQFISEEERSITMKNEGYDVPDNDYCDKIGLVLLYVSKIGITGTVRSPHDRCLRRRVALYRLGWM